MGSWGRFGWNVDGVGPLWPRPREGKWVGLAPLSSPAKEEACHARRRQLCLVFVPLSFLNAAVCAVALTWRGDGFLATLHGVSLASLLGFGAVGVLVRVSKDPRRSRTLMYLIYALFLSFAFCNRLAFGVDPALSEGWGHLIGTCAWVLLICPSLFAVCFGQVSFMVHLLHALVVASSALAMRCGNPHPSVESRASSRARRSIGRRWRSGRRKASSTACTSPR